MNIAFWSCCGKSYTQNVSKCRVCGKIKPTYGIIPGPEKTPQRSTKPVRQPRKSRDPLISDNEDQLFVSTIKFLDE